MTFIILSFMPSYPLSFPRLTHQPFLFHLLPFLLSRHLHSLHLLLISILLLSFPSLFPFSYPPPLASLHLGRPFPRQTSFFFPFFKPLQEPLIIRRTYTINVKFLSKMSLNCTLLLRFLLHTLTSFLSFTVLSSVFSSSYSKCRVF